LSQLEKEFAAIAAKLKSDFERSANLPHQGVKGHAREVAVVKDYLRPKLARRYSIGSGLITDATGQFSKQQDIVVFDDFNFPVLQDFEDDSLYFAEQVLAVIEVKSTFRRESIKDLIASAASISELGHNGSTRGSSSFVFGFGYKSDLSLAQIRDYAQQQIHENKSGWGVGAIIILEDKEGAAGIVSNADQHQTWTVKVNAEQQDPTALIKAKSVGHALFLFNLLLQEAIRLAETTITTPDYLAYGAAAGFGEVSSFEIGEIGVRGLPYQQAIDVIRDAHNRTVDEVVRAYRHLLSMGLTSLPDLQIDNETLFKLNNDVLYDDHRPAEVHASLWKYLSGKYSEHDRQLVEYLVRLLQHASQSNGYLEIVSLDLENRVSATLLRIGRLG
jgi:hypothetical protein